MFQNRLRMDDFFKNIKDNLEDRQEPAFSEGAWRNMEKRLNKKPWRGIPFFTWVLPFVLISLFLSNLFFYKELNKANAKISQLEFKTDTIFKTQCIYHYDTVFSNQVETKYIAVSSPVRANVYRSTGYDFSIFELPLGSDWINRTRAPLTFSDLNDLFEGRIQSYGQLVKSQQLSTVQNDESPKSKLLQDFSFLPSKSSNLEYSSNLVGLRNVAIPAEAKKFRKRPVRKFVENLRPNGFRLGINGGLAFPRGKDLAEPEGYFYGIRMEFPFSENLRLWTEVSYFKVNFKTDVVDEKIGIPAPQPPSDLFAFSEAKVVQPFIEYGLGFQYLFYAHKKWKPYLGLGYTAASILPYEIRYDFAHVSENSELSIDKDVQRDGFISNMLLLNGGVEAKLSKKIHFQLEGYYRWNGSNGGVLIPDILGLKTKLIYKF